MLRNGNGAGKKTEVKEKIRLKQSLVECLCFAGINSSTYVLWMCIQSGPCSVAREP